jgi:hypothetical protein
MWRGVKRTKGGRGRENCLFLSPGGSESHLIFDFGCRLKRSTRHLLGVLFPSTTSPILESDLWEILNAFFTNLVGLSAFLVLFSVVDYHTLVWYIGKESLQVVKET